MRVVLISDTHSSKPEVPDGDIIIHAGDHTWRGTDSEIYSAINWYSKLPHKHKVAIAGNHDHGLENRKYPWTGIYYLEDSMVKLEGLKIWGSPCQPWFNNWAFNIKDPARRKMMWDLIPDDTDILVTHCPPHGILDLCHGGYRAGCEELRKAVERVKPKVHVFGHIHESRGTLHFNGTTFVNASTMNLRCFPVHSAYVVEF